MRFDFSGVKPAKITAYAVPVGPDYAGLLVFTGASQFGSHAMANVAACLRRSALSGLRPERLPVSDQSGKVNILSDVGNTYVRGPFTEATVAAVGGRATNVYMIRGTIVHVALAHEVLRQADARGERVLVGGTWYTPDPEWPLYPSNLAVESAALCIGPAARKQALSEGRQVLASIPEWVSQFLDTHKIVAVETEFAWNLDAPWSYTARIDLVAQSRASGLVYFFDYKTISNVADAKRRYGIAHQLHAHHILGELWAGPQWGGVKVVTIMPGEPSLFDLFSLPRSPIPAMLRDEIPRVMGKLKSYADQSPAQWPANPYACSDCDVRKLCGVG